MAAASHAFVRGTHRGTSLRRWLARCALVIAPLAVGPSGATAAPSWAVHHDRAERLLRAGDAAGAEAEILAALAVEPRSACRVRIHGMVFVDYLPWFTLGIARVRQGRLIEAREAFDREAAEGVISSCGSTRRQSLDLAEFLTDLAAPPRAAGETPVGLQPRVSAELRGAAEDAATTVRLALADDGGVPDPVARRTAEDALATADGLLMEGSRSVDTALEASLAAQRGLTALATAPGARRLLDAAGMTDEEPPPESAVAPASGAMVLPQDVPALARRAEVALLDLAWSPSLLGAPPALLRPPR